MTENLILFHRYKPKQPAKLGAGRVVLNTCMRSIVVMPSYGDATDLEGYDCYPGAQAVTFLLETVCGLKSPLIGETEVYGQFKQAIDEQSQQMDHATKQLVDMVNRQAKEVRTKYLKGLGSQSYGSLVRRFIKGQKSVVFLGAGQLAQEIYPWVKKDVDAVSVFCRNPMARYQDGEWDSNADLKSLSKGFVAERSVTVIVAAPMSAVDIQSFLSRQNAKIEAVIDLRGESRKDPLSDEYQVISLDEAFKEIQKSQCFAKQMAEKAQKHILALARESLELIQVRPFGWEDAWG